MPEATDRSAADNERIPPRRRRRVLIENDGEPVIEAGETIVTDADVQAWRDADQR